MTTEPVAAPAPSAVAVRKRRRFMTVLSKFRAETPARGRSRPPSEDRTKPKCATATPENAVGYPSSRWESMLRGRAAANIQSLLLGGYPYMVVVALPFRVTDEISGEIEDPVAGEFVLSQAHSVPAKRKGCR